MSVTTLRTVSDALLAKRRDQRGFRTLGDEHDRALVEALAGAPADPTVERELDRVGELLGREVYARRFFEDSLPGATAVLGTCLLESGLGSLQLESHFHRTALLRYARPPALAHAPALALVCAVARGYYGSAFNCRVDVRSTGDLLHLRLLDGRDVNRGSSA